MYWEDPFSQGESYRAVPEKIQFEHELTRMIEVGIAQLLQDSECMLLPWQTSFGRMCQMLMKKMLVLSISLEILKWIYQGAAHL